MNVKILKDLYCFQCSLQFDKKSIYELHLKLVHDYRNIARSLFGTNIKVEPEESNMSEKHENNLTKFTKKQIFNKNHPKDGKKNTSVIFVMSSFLPIKD